MLTENDVADIQGLLDQMLTGGRIAPVTENFELDVTDVQLRSSPAGRRHPQR